MKKKHSKNKEVNTTKTDKTAQVIRKWWLLILIVLVASLLRLWHIDINPPALSWDEVSIGYNAFSILTTGKSEHGRFLPLDTFIGYGDYKPPISIYLTVPAVALFGLTEFAVRLPSALAGIAAVAATYFLVVELFTWFDKRRELALLSSALLAVSPWHINLSRAGFEGNIAVFFVILGTLLILKAKKDKRFHLWARKSRRICDNFYQWQNNQ